MKKYFYMFMNSDLIMVFKKNVVQKLSGSFCSYKKYFCNFICHESIIFEENC